jgi:uncharacterized membrane protein
MTGPEVVTDQSIADVLRRVARWGLAIGGVSLLTGLGLTVTGHDEMARHFLIGGLATLVSLPIVNVVVAVVEELRRREWLFLGLASAALLILLYNARHLARIIAGA